MSMNPFTPEQKAKLAKALVPYFENSEYAEGLSDVQLAQSLREMASNIPINDLRFALLDETVSRLLASAEDGQQP